MCEHDRVAFHVLAHPPGEQQVRPLLRRRLALGTDLGVGEIVGWQVAGLHEQSAINAAILVGRSRPGDRAGAEQAEIGAPFASSREDFAGLGRKVRGDDALDEAVRLGNARRGRFIHVAVEAENSAEGTEWVAVVGALECLVRRLAECRAAGIVVFQHHRGRLGELANEVQRAIKIEQIVVRQFFPAQHFGGGDAHVPGGRLDVHGGRLVRVFAVAKQRLAAKGEIERRRKRMI